MAWSGFMRIPSVTRLQHFFVSDIDQWEGHTHIWHFMLKCRWKCVLSFVNSLRAFLLKSGFCWLYGILLFCSTEFMYTVLSTPPRAIEGIKINCFNLLFFSVYVTNPTANCTWNTDADFRLSTLSVIIIVASEIHANSLLINNLMQ